jgi:4-aminobutyrate aminotransferase/(S)-3-amino-2-methylpropionate transaminase
MRRWPESHGEALHTSTHLGNPLGCAAALAVLETLRGEGLLARSESLGARWLERLGKRVAGNPRVRELRGRGLLVALELDDADFARAAAGRALRAGWVVLGEGPEGRTLALTPPLTIAESLLERAAEVLAEALE